MLQKAAIVLIAFTSADAFAAHYNCKMWARDNAAEVEVDTSDANSGGEASSSTGISVFCGTISDNGGKSLGMIGCGTSNVPGKKQFEYDINTNSLNTQEFESVSFASDSAPVVGHSANFSKSRYSAGCKRK